MSDGRDGPSLELRGLFEQFLREGESWPGSRLLRGYIRFASKADVNYGIAGCREVARTPAPQQTTRTGLRLAGFKRERQRGAAPASPQSAD